MRSHYPNLDLGWIKGLLGWGLQNTPVSQPQFFHIFFDIASHLHLTQKNFGKKIPQKQRIPFVNQG